MQQLVIIFAQNYPSQTLFSAAETMIKCLSPLRRKAHFTKTQTRQPVPTSHKLNHKVEKNEDRFLI